MLSLRKFDFTSKNSYQGCHISKIAQQNLVKHTSLRSIFIKNLYAPNFMDGHSYVPLGQLCLFLPKKNPPETDNDKAHDDGGSRWRPATT